MLRPKDTWLEIGPRAKESQLASFRLRSAFDERLEHLFKEYHEALEKLPKRRRSDLSVQHEVFSRYATTFRLELEQHIIAMDQALKDEIKSRIGVEGENRLGVALNRLGAALLQDWPFKNLSRLIAEECTALLSCKSTFLYVADSRGELNREKGFETGKFRTADILLDPIVREVLDSKKPRLVNDPTGGGGAVGASMSKKVPWTIQNLVAFPIVLGERVLGVIVCTNKDNGFTKEDTNTLSRVSGHVGVIFQKLMMQKEVPETNQFYEDLVTSAGQAIISVGQGKLTSWNEEAGRVFGYTGDEVLGKGLDMLFAEGEGERVSSRIEEILRTGAPSSFEARGIRKDGSRIHVMVTLSRLKGSSQVVGIISGMDEPRRPQSEPIQSEKTAAVDPLISWVAHELNSPLAAVVGFSDLLQERAGMDPDVVEDLRMIHTNAARCRDVVAKLLRFACKGSTQFGGFDLSQAIRDAVGLREQEMSRGGVEVSLEDEAGSLNAYGNPGQIQQAFLNLLNNAFDAVVAKGGPGSVRIQVSRTDRMGIVEFRDTGIGIPSDHLTKVFDPFFTTKGPGHGTGLGLSLSYRIVKDHGGNIRAYSEDGKGATFRVELPLSTPGLADSLPEASGEKGPEELQDKRIIVVDVERDIQFLFHRVLSKEGASVTTTGDPREALLATEQEKPDLIVTDVILPGEMNGFDLFSELRQRWPELKSKILFMSGDTVNPMMQARLDELGARMLPKPFGKQDILAAVRECLSGEPGVKPDTSKSVLV